MSEEGVKKTVPEAGRGVPWKPVLVLAGAVAAALLLGLALRGGGREESADTRATFVVRRGDLDITIEQTGELQTKNPTKIMAEISGEATIAELVEEGSTVKKDDLLVRLDSSQMEENLTNQEIELENSRARLVQAEESKKIQKLNNTTNIASAELGLANAERASEKYGTVALDGNGFLDEAVYESGQGPARGEAYQEYRDAELAIKRAQTNLDKAERDFDGMDELKEKGFVTKNDNIEAELKVDEAQRSLESAKLKHDLLRRYNYPSKLAQLEADVAKAKGSLEEANLSASAQMVQREASITQSQRIYDKNKEKLDETTEELSKMTILAPEDGLVLYGEESRPWERESIKVGAKVSRGRVILTLPRISAMMVATKVLEKDVNKVKVGQKAAVKVSALEELGIEGEVSKVGSVASSGRRWHASSETKTFDVEVSLNGGDERMRPGMSCDVTIMVEKLEGVLYVPVNAVFKREGQDICYVVKGGGTEMRSVEVGKDNELYVEIQEGLEEGEPVLLYSVSASEEATLEKPDKEDEDEGEAAEEEGAAENEEGVEQADGADEGETGEGEDAEEPDEEGAAENEEGVEQAEPADEGETDDAEEPDDEGGTTVADEDEGKAGDVKEDKGAGESGAAGKATTDEVKGGDAEEPDEEGAAENEEGVEQADDADEREAGDAEESGDAGKTTTDDGKAAGADG